ncbi:MAG: hypothetical protein KatS3mg076_2042 [Candidatus Binatia bacterium]|nr:MAG: hypothetical protein KatS3mg076_2042 [Candidatus Binatia bacterium]
MQALPLRLGKREQTKARNRAVILAAARLVFGRLGVERATVRDIVRATDLSVGTFYEYFRDKKDVFRAVLEDTLSGLRQRLRSVRRDVSLPFEERIYRAYLAFFRFVVEERVLFEVLERNVWRLGEDPTTASLSRAVEELREDLLPDFAAHAPGGHDPEDVAAAMIGTGLMVARQRLVRGELDPEKAARFCTAFSLRGLTRASTSERLPYPKEEKR